MSGWAGFVGDVDNWLHGHGLGSNPVGRLICGYYDYLTTGSWHPERDDA